MKRLRPLDFLAPPARPWAGYILLSLAGATLVGLGWVFWMTRAPDGLEPLPRRSQTSDSSPGTRNSPPTTATANPPPAMTAPQNNPAASGAAAGLVTGGNTVAAPAVAVEPAALSASSTESPAASTAAASAQAVAALQPAADAYADATLMREQFQLRQTRALGGPKALPWADILAVLQVNLRAGVSLLGLGPDAVGATPAGRVRVTARASDDARMRAFVDALQVDSRLHDVILVSPVLAEPDGSGLRFSVVLGWRGNPDGPRASGPTSTRDTVARP
jgi:Tfp pilus assembly protein PilN